MDGNVSKYSNRNEDARLMGIRPDKIITTVAKVPYLVTTYPRYLT